MPGPVAGSSGPRWDTAPVHDLPDDDVVEILHKVVASPRCNCYDHSATSTRFASRRYLAEVKTRKAQLEQLTFQEL